MISQTKQKGFTIVELLIVIVVIGILAAISIVAYAGLQNNAKSSERAADAANIIKVAEAMNADNDTYPTTAAGMHATGGSAKLPANVRLNATPLTAAPAATEAAAGPSKSGDVKTYNWRSCGASNGITVYYFDPKSSGGGLKTVSAGVGC